MAPGGASALAIAVQMEGFSATITTSGAAISLWFHADLPSPFGRSSRAQIASYLTFAAVAGQVTHS